jgi:hypothetical protein
MNVLRLSERGMRRLAAGAGAVALTAGLSGAALAADASGVSVASTVIKGCYNATSPEPFAS